MKNWTKKALSKSEKTNGFSRQNSKSRKKPPNSRKEQRSQREEKINSSQKKARCETVEAQLNNIEKWMHKGMKLLLHLDNSDELADISISVSPETTFKGLKRKISQTTRISPGNQVLILKGKEWPMEGQEKICQCCTADDLVAVFQRKYFSSGESVAPSTKFKCMKYKIINRFFWSLSPVNSKKCFTIIGNSGSDC